ncbi:JAB domain-containing protein [Sphingopyxis sp. NJF-3]
MTKCEPVGAPDPATMAGFASRTDEDEIARQLLRPCFAPDREILLLAAFDAFERLTAFERIDEGTAGRCAIAPPCWHNLLGRGVQHVLMAHNHPSADPRPSRADIDCTREAAAFLAVLDVDLVDHLIFVESGHFSFRRGRLL